MPHTKLSSEERERYARHLSIPDFGEAAQLRLRESKVLIVGAGGLGSPLLLYLAAAGVGTLGFIDPDVVEPHNLQRQVLYGNDDVGRPKVEAAEDRLRGINPLIRLIPIHDRLTSFNALDILKDYDVIADGSDNFPTRYLVNDACVLLDKVNVFGSVFRFEGQVTVFNALRESGERGPNYRDLFPSPPPPNLVPDCATGGVLGVLPGMVGSFQAIEAIKIITGLGQTLDGVLMLVDALNLPPHRVKIPYRSPRPEIKELIDYEAFCGLPDSDSSDHEISTATLREWQTTKPDLLLIDVRSPTEFEQANIGGQLIPHSELMEFPDQLPKNRPVVLVCRSGQRSGSAWAQLQKVTKHSNIYSLNGGLEAWKREQDTSLPL